MSELLGIGGGMRSTELTLITKTLMQSVTADGIHSLDQSSKLHLLQTLTIKITFITLFQ